MIHLHLSHASCLCVVTCCGMSDDPKFPLCDSEHGIMRTLQCTLQTHHVPAFAEIRRQTAASAARVWLDRVAQAQEHMTKVDFLYEHAGVVGYHIHPKQYYRTAVGFTILSKHCLLSRMYSYLLLKNKTAQMFYQQNVFERQNKRLSHANNRIYYCLLSRYLT